MPRKNLIRIKNFPYHVTTRTHNQDFFPLEQDKIWELVNYSFQEANKIHPIHLISFVLMSNHYHMLLTTPDENLDLFMYEFNKRLAQKINFYSQNKNQVFGGRYRWNLIQSNAYLMNCYRYIYQNPIRAGLTLKAEDYPYSSLYFIKNKMPFSIPLHDTFGFKDEFGLNWINQKLDSDTEIKVKKGFRKSMLL
jgi:putative transposase